MKNVLIAGQNSYIARSFSQFCKDDFIITAISARNGFENIDFSGYDSILYCSGAVHLDKKTPREHFFKLNCEQPLDCATRAYNAGIKQFVFLSSMSVFGKAHGCIDKNTPVLSADAKDAYGASKAAGEYALSQFSEESDGTFLTAIVRPPIVYGKGCKGNFARLEKLVTKTPLFPDINNRHSMLYIENLCRYLKLIIEDERGGFFHPQNSKYVRVSELAKKIADEKGENLRLTKVFNPAVKLLAKGNGSFGKLFGNLTYEKSFSDDVGKNYCPVSFDESVQRSVG